jgi:hypothetical protein
MSCLPLYLQGSNSSQENSIEHNKELAAALRWTGIAMEDDLENIRKPTELHILLPAIPVAFLL